jgi:hypothetical protein
VRNVAGGARSDWRASSLRPRPPHPLPASPAPAASMVALSADWLVGAAKAEIVSTTEPIRSAASLNVPMTLCVRFVSATADCAVPSPLVACWAISWMDPDGSSVAITVASMRRAVSDEALEADAIRLSVSSAICRSTGQRQRSRSSLMASITSWLWLRRTI